MTPFSAFATTRWLYGPERLVRYNGSAAYEIQGENATGFSSGDAMTNHSRPRLFPQEDCLPVPPFLSLHRR
ncbi:efflux RND transporter permease subunit, partial [Escherichia coli]|uniref:efflux RND transporter permease subunit n=1 Tax=Escherichia coli TaxID=562 RepID=UPI003D2F201E